MPVRVAVAGAGNCAAVFLQGLEYYSGRGKPGLWHPIVSGLKPSNLEVVAAFDIDPRKVGLELSRAAFATPNVARKYTELPKTGVKVAPGLSEGDLPPHLAGVRPVTGTEGDVVEVLESSRADVLLNLVSSGSDASSEAYAKGALRAGCAFVNCTPSLLLRNGRLSGAFSKAKVPLVGDDLMSQFGGTVFHKGLLGLLVKRGIRISKSYQLDVGGGSETLNTINEGIKMAKRGVKTASVAFEVPYDFETIAGTTDYVDYMGNDRTSYFWFEGAGFMGSPVTVDVYLRSSDGANAGNILLDVARATYGIMKDRRLERVQDICAYGFKSPRRKTGFEEAYSRFVSAFVPVASRG